jgi:hypothetical protein
MLLSVIPQIRNAIEILVISFMVISPIYSTLLFADKMIKEIDPEQIQFFERYLKRLLEKIVRYFYYAASFTSPPKKIEPAFIRLILQ